MKTTCVAPRLIASMPTAPVPAKTSRKREPATLVPRTLKRVSRRRSLVGRRAVPLRDLRMRLRYLPATMRIVLAHFRQVVAALPFGGEELLEALQGGGLRRIVGDGEGFEAGEFQEFAVAQRIGDVEAESARLTGAEKFAGAAKLQIGFGDF